MSTTIKTIQSGAVSIASGDGTTIDVNLGTAVTTANAFIMYSRRGGDTTPRVKRHNFTVDFVDTDTIRFTRYESGFAQDVDLEWTVVEFDTGVLAQDVQRGTFSHTGTSTDQTITAVSLSETFSILHQTVQANSFEENSIGYGHLTSTTNVQYVTGVSAASNFVAGYQVVEFDSSTDIEVDQGTLTFADDTSTQTATIGSVDLTKSFLLNNGTSSTDAFNGISRLPVSYSFSNSTTVLGTKQVDEPVVSSYCAVELKGGQSVESFSVTIPDTATVPTAQPSWTALDTDNTALMFGFILTNGWLDNGSGDEQDVYVSASLDAGADGATYTRVGAGDGVYSAEGFAVDWTDAAVTSRFPYESIKMQRRQMKTLLTR